MSTRDDVEIRDKITVFQGHFRVDRYRLRHRLHAGGWSGEMTREVFERGHAAAVLPYDPVRDEVVLIEQFRVGAYAAGFAPWLVEIVAGIIDPGETAEQVVRREAHEEAGLTIGEVEPIAHYLSSPGGASESVTLFCGRVDTSTASGIHGHPDEGEDILVRVHSYAAVEQMLRAASVSNAVTLIALQWLALNRDGLRARWR
ncbi:MAG TPA: ADP-ribose diphosphatase [Alphaproteobacteria bacterium]|jgi:ADP-ribose pyrophosphatase|nr:ADP-ribose diphosphatase [Alphaproteobacteria bacterium]